MSRAKPAAEPAISPAYLAATRFAAEQLAGQAVTLAKAVPIEADEDPLATANIIGVKALAQTMLAQAAFDGDHASALLEAAIRGLVAELNRGLRLGPAPEAAAS